MTRFLVRTAGLCLAVCMLWPGRTLVAAQASATSAQIAGKMPALPAPTLTWDSKTQGAFVMSLCRGLDGSIWAGTEDDGVWRWDPKAPAGGQWTHFTTKDGLGDDDAYALACDWTGCIWAGSLNHGVSVYNGMEWRNYDLLTGPLGSRVFAIAICPTDGDVWMATDAGLARYSLHWGTWTYYTRAEGLPSDQANALAFNRAGDLFVGTQCDGIAIGRAKDNYKKWAVVTGPEQMPNTPGGAGLPTNLINCLLASRAGTVYAGTTTGLARSEDDGKTWRYLRGADWEAKVLGLYHGPKPVDADTHGHLMLEDYVTALAEDDAGRLWIGYRQKGLEVVDEVTGNELAKYSDDYVTALTPGPLPRCVRGERGPRKRRHPACRAADDRADSPSPTSFW